MTFLLQVLLYIQLGASVNTTFSIDELMLIHSSGLSSNNSIIDKVNHAKLQKKKPSLKQKILMKWLKKKSTAEQQKKGINTLGWMSFIGAILGMVVFPLGWIVFAFAIVGLSFSFLSIVLGLISLIKRSKLEDKSGTKRWPGMLGIIIGSGFLIAITIWVLIELS